MNPIDVGLWVGIFSTLFLLSALSLKFKAIRVLVFIIFLIPLVFTVLFFIFKHEPISATDVNKLAFFQRFKVGCHRGSHHGVIPENSIEAYKACKAEGAQLIETDIQLTSDSVPVISHDDNTVSFTGVDKEISQMTFAEFQQLRFTLNNASLLTFEQSVEWCVQNDMLMIWDVKSIDDTLVNIFETMVKKYNLYSKIIISGFNPINAYKVKSKDKNILTGFTWRSWELSSIAEDGSVPRFGSFLTIIAVFLDKILTGATRSLIIPSFLGVDMLLFHCNDVSRAQQLDGLRNDMYTVGWTTNNPAEMSFYLSATIPFLTDNATVVPFSTHVYNYTATGAS